MQVSGYNYSYYSPYSSNQSSSSSLSMTGLLDTLATGAGGNKSGTSNSSQAAITGFIPSAAINSSTGSQVSVPGASYLTQSDLALIRETTGQTIDPKTGEPVNASGKVVLWNMPDMQFEIGIIAARMGGIPNGSGGTTAITGALTAADLQSIANQYSGISGTTAVFQKAESILNGTAAA